MDNLKKIIAGTTLTITLATAGMLGDYYVDKEYKLNKKFYTGHEYAQIKKALIEKIKKNKETPAEYDEFLMWIDMVNIESTRCGDQMVLTNVNNDNLLDKINAYLEECNK